MNIKIQQFLFGKNHSWSVVGKEIGRSFLSQGHNVDFVSTDGIVKDYYPDDLKVYSKQDPSIHNLNLPNKLNNYDLQVSYTAPINFPKFLNSGTKNRFGIWCYEFDVMPSNFPKYQEYVDKILPPSNFAKEIFIKNKFSENKLEVVPHGINKEFLENKGNKYPLKTKKSIKFLIDLGQPHLRKNIEGTVRAFYKAFSNKDDVCLVAKIHVKKIEAAFDVDVIALFNKLQKEFKNHPETELIPGYVSNIVDLYNSCDVLYSLTFAECFFLPALQGLALDKIVIVPRYGGQLDFCDDENSFLVEGKITRADQKMQYWVSNINNSMFSSDIDDAVDKLRFVYNNFDSIKIRNNQNIRDKYTWDAVTKQIIGLI